MNFIFLIQARLGSKRFNEKILEKIYGNATLIDFILFRLLSSKYISTKNLWVLTTNNKLDDKLVEHLLKKGINVFRGSENNVYKRFFDFLSSLDKKPKYFFRICADNPCIEISFIENMIDFINSEKDRDYISYMDKKQNLPAMLCHYGLFCELINTKTFLSVKSLIKSKKDKEHVTSFFYNNTFNNFFFVIPNRISDLNIRLTVDTPADLKIIQEILHYLKEPMLFNYCDLLNILLINPKFLTDMEVNKIKNQK
jgi:spore coat polysaccharide biosynthesis protein SpsF